MLSKLIALVGLAIFAASWVGTSALIGVVGQHVAVTLWFFGIIVGILLWVFCSEIADSIKYCIGKAWK